MKKLMFAAAAAAVAGGAFATPLVYDYKASVKHMYEKEARVDGVNAYVKYVKSSQISGFFVQDVDGATTLAKSDMTAGYNGGVTSEKRGFLVVMNKSAEKGFRAPKIMPAQLDVKTCLTAASGSGSKFKTKVVAEAYFYAGPFASAPDTFTAWDAAYDGGIDYLFYGGNAALGGAVATRSYGTTGSTLYLFGQHNTYNRFIADASVTPKNDHRMPSTVATTGIYAFGDAWLNGAGFGKGSGTTTLCCGWGAVDGGFGALSGNLKGGLFLCSISGKPSNNALGFFALGLEDVFASDLTAALGKIQNGDDYEAADPEDLNLWADGDIALNTTDVVSGTWTLKPRASFNPVALTAAEAAWFAGTGAPNFPASREVAEYVKAASQSLDRNYSLTVGTAAGDTNQPENRAGRNTAGLIPWNFAFLYF